MAEVPLSDVSAALTQHAHARLQQLGQQLQATPDPGRRLALQQYVAQVRTLLLRLLTLVRWAQARHASFVVPCSSDALRLDAQHIGLRGAEHELNFLHRDGLWQACVPPYDIRAALDVVCRGTYTQLPRAIAPPHAPHRQDDDSSGSAASDATAALAWLRSELRLRRSAWKLPARTLVRDARGSIVCTVPGEYELAVSAHPPADGPLKVLRLSLLVSGAAGGRAWTRAQQRVQQALDALPEQPLIAVHGDLHAVCCDQALDALHAQATLLRAGPWSSSLKVERVASTAPADPAGRSGSGAAGVLLSYVWQPASGFAAADASAARRASILISSAAESGLRLRHDPPLPTVAGTDAEDGDGWSWVSSAELSAEALLIDALHLRSKRTLDRSARGPDGEVGASTLSTLVDNGQLPMLRVTEHAALTISHRDGQYACLARGNATRRLLGVPGAAATSVSGGVAATALLRLSAPLAALERAASAVGVHACAMPTLEPLHAAGGALLWAPLPNPSPDTLADARWLPLEGLPGWGIEVRMSNPTTKTDAAGPFPAMDFCLLRLNTMTRDVQRATVRAVVPFTAEVDAAVAAAAPAAPQADKLASESDDGAARVAFLMPVLLGTAAARAAVETLRTAAAAAGLLCEQEVNGTRLQLTDLPRSGLACPPAAAAMQRPADTPRAAPLLRVSTEATGRGWEAFVPQLSAPAGVSPVSTLCSGAATVCFDSSGATLRYDVANAWAVHDLLLDLQGVAMAHALLRQLAEARATGGGDLDGVKLAEASCAGIGLHTRANRHVRIEWRGSSASAVPPPSAAATVVEPPPHPVLQLRLRVDGVVLAAVHRPALNLLASGALGELLRLCDVDGQRGSAREGASVREGGGGATAVGAPAPVAEPAGSAGSGNEPRAAVAVDDTAETASARGTTVSTSGAAAPPPSGARAKRRRGA